MNTTPAPYLVLSVGCKEIQGCDVKTERPGLGEFTWKKNQGDFTEQDDSPKQVPREMRLSRATLLPSFMIRSDT